MTISGCQNSKQMISTAMKKMAEKYSSYNYYTFANKVFGAILESPWFFGWLDGRSLGWSVTQSVPNLQGYLIAIQC